MTAAASSPLMRRFTRLSCLTALMSAFALHTGMAHAAQADVRFADFKNMTDVRDNRLGTTDIVRPFTDYLTKLADKLPTDQKLTIEFLDIDLAGEIEPIGPRMEMIRTLRANNWPRMQLRYTLSDAAGTALRSGEVKLSDIDYMDHSNKVGESDPLRYEKQMLKEWFQKEFPAK